MLPLTLKILTEAPKEDEDDVASTPNETPSEDASVEEKKEKEEEEKEEKKEEEAAVNPVTTMPKAAPRKALGVSVFNPQMMAEIQAKKQFHGSGNKVRPSRHSSLYLSLSPSYYLSVNSSMKLSLHLFLFLFVDQSTHLPIYVSLLYCLPHIYYPSINFSIHVSYTASHPTNTVYSYLYSFNIYFNSK